MSRARDIADSASTINALDNVTASGAELNILDGVTSTTAELNILDGVTSTTAELNILDGVTSTASELNILDGVTATATEINKLDGVSRGSLIYGNASAETALLTKGSANQVLTSDGTDIAWANAAAGGTNGWEFISNTTVSNSATVDISNAVSSSYSAIRVIIENLKCATSQISGVIMKFYNGSTLDTGNNYGYSMTVSNNFTVEPNSGFIAINTENFGTQNTHAGLNADILITGTTNSITFVRSHSMLQIADNHKYNPSTGLYKSTSAVSGVQIYNGAGANFSSGTVRVFALKNS